MEWPLTRKLFKVFILIALGKMSYNNSNYQSSDDADGLKYDLRQIYAGIVGEHFNMVYSARESGIYDEYYRRLKWLVIPLNHKIDIEKIEELKARLQTIVDANPKIWLRKKSDPQIEAEIEDILNSMEMMLYKAAAEAGVFGSTWNDDGL